MKSLLRSFLFWIAIGIFAYYQLPQLRSVWNAVRAPSFSNLVGDDKEMPYERPIMEAFTHFPSEEKEFYFGDFDDKDLFENHPLLDLTFPRRKTAAARCGFRKWLPTLKPEETVLYSGVVHVVCRR